MLQPRADVPLVMIALARPELLDRRPGWGGGRRNAISIALEPLPSSAVEALVADLLDAPAPEIVNAVVDRAEGNPFYAGEIVRSLVDRLGPVPDPAAVAGAIAALPDTVQATVLARLDALPPAARRVVQLGAVLGRTFEPRAIPAIDPALSAEAVDAAIGDLLDRDLIRTAQLGAATFRHILIREVAYSTLPRAERARLHGAAGRWLIGAATASGRTDELAELVAFHLREAVSLGSLLGESVPEDLGALAVEWLRRAAEAAAAGAAAAEAARHLNAAIELAPREDQPDLYERLGQIWSGGDQGAEALERAWQLGRELALGPEQELRTLGQAMVVRARWLGSIGQRLDDDEKARRYEEIGRLLDADISELARFHGQLAIAFRASMGDTIVQPDLEEGELWAERAIATARRLGQADLLSAALDAADAVALTRDDMARVLEFVEERHSIQERVSTSERADAWIVNAWAEAIRGNLVAAEQAAEQARAGLGTGQAASFVLGATAWRVFALHALGRWDEALADAVRAERALQESEFSAPWYSFNGFLSALAIARGRGDAVGAAHWRDLMLGITRRTPPEARIGRVMGYVTEDLGALERGTVHEFRIFSPRLDYVHLGMALLADRRHPVAVDSLTAIVDYAEERQLALIASQARRLRGVVAATREDLEVALAGFSAMGARPFASRVRTELGLLVADRALVEQGLDELAALGDVDQATRVAGELRAGAHAGASAG